MAQIVTITNPLTGQPAQVDQLDHTAQQIDDAIARALPDGAIDTLLAGKAPAGYGLGTTPKKITDWNAANVCGWYECDSGAANSPDSNFGWFGLTYTTGNPEVFVQDVFTLANTKQYYHRRRLYYPGTGNGTPWEWVDPLLYEGVEYRTTERCMGKPVYVKLVNFGALPNATTKEADTGISIAYNIIDRAVYSINPGGYEIVDMNRFELEDKLVVGSASWSYLVVSTSDYSSYTTTYVTFKYTKD